MQPFRKLLHFGALVIVYFLTFTVYAQVQLSDKLPVDPQLKIGKLPNGLTYYIRKNSRPENKVELRLVVNAGSVLEDDDQQGLAHFTEHMAFNGSKNFKKNDIVSFLQSIGVEFGADLNAYTGFDETVYILPIPTVKKENVQKAFQILEDWASTVAFDPGELDKERSVVLEEERLGKGAEDRLFRATYPKMFEGSIYANRLPIGKPEVIKSFKPDAIKRFYKDWYRPNLMAVVAVGDIDVAEVEALIKKHFQKLRNPAKERKRNLAEVAVRNKSEGMVVTDPEATNQVVEIYYSYYKDKPEETVGEFREYLVEALFRNMLSQRMQELTQKAEPPFVYGTSTIGGWARGYEGFSSFAYVGKGGPEPAIRALILENERARQFGFTDGELDRVKKMMMKGMERAYAERDKTESSALTEEYVRNFLEGEPIPGIENEYQYYQQFLSGIKLDEVNRYAARIIPQPDQNKLVILTGPEKNEFSNPTNEELLRMAENAASQEILKYEEKAIATSLLDNKPVAGKIVKSEEDKALGTTTLSFSNNTRVILKPTNFKNDQVVIMGSRFGGQYLFDLSDRDNAEYASVVVSQMGYGNFSPLDLRKFLAGKSASVSTRLGSISESMSGQCSAIDLETMLQLTYLFFTSPRKDQDLFNSFVQKQQALYQNMMSDPEYTFQDSVIHILYKNQPWAPRLPKSQTFSRLSLERVAEIYKERFGDASGFTFVLSGNFEIDKIKPLLETYIAGLPSTGREPKFKDVGLRPIQGTLKREVKKGTEQKSLIRLFWNGEAPYSQDEQLRLQALAEVMNIRMTETLREELGGIYNGGMFASLNKYPYNSYSVGVSLPCGPENVDQLVKATLAEIEKMKLQGPTETDLNKVKETWKQQYLVNIRENAFWARQLLQAVELQISPNEIIDYEKRIASITIKEVQEAAKKYVPDENRVQIVLNPEK